MFGVPKDLALKMAIKPNNRMPNTTIKLYKAQFQTGPTKNWQKMTKKMQKFTTFRAQKRLKMTF